MELCSTETFNRIRNCPTYPVATITLDLEERVQLLRDSIALNPYEISNALAFLYESTVDNQSRKNYGQFFTPLPVTKQVISHLALQSGETVLDPGCGTGIFPLSIMRNLIDRSIDSTSITYIGVENDPVLALSAAISLEWIKAPTKWQVHYANFLLLKPEDLPQIDVIIANPPFVRFHRLGDKEKLREGLSRSEKYALSSYSGLHSYFLSHSSQFLKDGRMIFIVPIEMNNTQYGLKLLKQLRQKFTITGKIMYTRARKKGFWRRRTVKS